MLSQLKRYTEDFINTVSDGMNLMTKQKFNEFEDIAEISSDDLEGFKALNEAFTAYCSLATEYAERTEVMIDKLDDIQTKLKDIDGRLDKLEARAEVNLLSLFVFYTTPIVKEVITMMDYLIVGIVYADICLLVNMFEDRKIEGIPYRFCPFGIRLITYLLDFILWPLGLMSDVGLI